VFSHPRSKRSDDLHWPAVLDGSTSGLTPVPIDASTADRRSAQFDLTQQSWAGHKSVTKRPAVPGHNPRLSIDEVLECRAGVKEPLVARPAWHGEACPLWTEVRGGRKTSPPASDTYSTRTNVSLTMIGPTRNGQRPRHLTTAEASQRDKYTGVHADIPTRIPTAPVGVPLSSTTYLSTACPLTANMLVTAPCRDSTFHDHLLRQQARQYFTAIPNPALTWTLQRPT
jgi:hypothetical protein